MKVGLYLISFFSAFFLALVLVPAARALALRAGVLDHPHERKIHEGSKPLLGGLAVVLAFLVVVGGGSAVFLVWGKGMVLAERLPWLVGQYDHFVEVLPRLWAVLGGGLILAVVGLVDDVRGVHFSPTLKLGTQVAAAVLVVLAGVRTSFMPGRVLDGVVTVVWIVGITNAFNLLDNMDGLSAGVAAIAGLLFFVVAASQEQVFTALILLPLAGSLLGFLRYNFHPSRIFMGDMGSLFVGFLLGTMTVEGSYVLPGGPGLLPVVMPVLILGVPIFDTLSVIVIRLREGRPVWVGDKRHFSHRLVDLGMSVPQAVVFIYLVTFCVGLSAVLLPGLGFWTSLIVLIQEVLLFGIVVSLMHVRGSKPKKRGR